MIKHRTLAQLAFILCFLTGMVGMLPFQVQAASTSSVVEQLAIESVDSYEPNDSTSAAKSISFGASFVSYISSETDQDFYVLNPLITGQSKLTLTVPSFVNYDLWIYDGNGNPIISSTNGTGVAEVINFRFTANKYYVRVVSADGTFGTASYGLSTSYLGSISNDDNGSRESFETAHTLPIPYTLDTYIGSETDVDYYKFTSAKTGLTDINISGYQYNEMDLYVYNSKFELINHSGTVGGRAQANAWVEVNQTYYVKVVASKYPANVDPYRLKLTDPVIDTYELNDRPDIAYPIEPGQTLSSKVSVVNDVDYYVFTSAFTDTMTVTYTTVSGAAVRVYEKGANGELLGVEVSEPAVGQKRFAVEAGHQYYVRVDGTRLSYTLNLSKHFYENYESNDTIETATNAIAKKLYKSYLFNASDVDFYRYTSVVTGKQHLTVKTPQGIAYEVKLLDSEQKVLQTQQTGPGLAHEFDFYVMAGQTYYFQVNGFDGSWSAVAPYELSVSPVRSEYQYDPANRLLHITMQSGTHIRQLQFTYDENGNLLKKQFLTFELAE